jgi:hypothetical protein
MDGAHWKGNTWFFGTLQHPPHPQKEIQVMCLWGLHLSPQLGYKRNQRRASLPLPVPNCQCQAQQGSLGRARIAVWKCRHCLNSTRNRCRKPFTD